MALQPTYRGAYDAFNPDVKDIQDPNWLNQSRAIETPHFVSAEALTIKGSGDLLAGAIKGADEIVEQFAKNTARSVAEGERDAAIAGTEAAQAQASPNAAKAQTPLQRVDVLGNPIGKPALPPGAEDLTNRAATIQAGKDQRKLPEEYYYGRMRMLAKDVRSQYPQGYRDVIDKEFASVTGGDPANMYFAAMRDNLRAIAGAQAKDAEHIGAQLRQMSSEGNPLASAIQEAYDKGHLNKYQVESAIAEQNSDKWRAAKIKTAIDIQNSTRDQIAQNMQDQAVHQFGVASYNNFQALELKLGSLIKKDANGNWIMPDPASANEVSTGLQQMHNNASMEMDRWMNGRDEKTGMSRRDVLSLKDPNLPETLKEQNLKIFKTAQDSIMSEKSGAFYAMNRATKATHDKTLYNITNIPGYGAALTTYDILNKINPQRADEFWRTNLDKLTPIENDGFKTIMSSITTQAARNTGSSASLNDVFTAAQKDGMTSKQFYYNLIDGLTNKGGITDPSLTPTEKQGIAQTLSNPKNLGFISSIAPDYYDQNGTWHPGQYSAFKNLGQKGVVEEMWKHPNEWKGYQGFIENTFAHELYNKELLSLNSLGNEANLSVAWDNEANQYHLMVKHGGKYISTHGELETKTYLTPGEAMAGGGRPVVDEASLRIARQTINRINDGLSVVKNIATVNKNFDVNAYLLSVMQATGVDFKNLDNPLSLPDKMLSALVAANNKPQKAPAAEPAGP